MTMPETAIHQDGGVVSRKYQVRSPWELWHMQTEAKTCRMQSAAQHELRPGVAAAYIAHIALALFRRENVHIRSPLKLRRRQ